ncbi:MAG: hypothetical protein E2O74_02375 [Chloroflexi bacterium]|nr:MAG: hypothetical protein E2O74_02375 [Chloroflexota bacterium]
MAYLWLLFWRLFGLRLWAYYLLNVLLQWSGALLVFLILRRIFLLNLGLAAVAAALALLYPADTTHVYLSTITTRMAGLIALVGAMLWLHVMTRPAESRLMLALSLFLMLLSLLTYETFLFLFAVLPLMLYLARPPTERNWVFRRAPIYSILLGYLAFRLGTAIVVTRARETYYAALRLEPEWLFTQLQCGFSGTSWKGWLYALNSIPD